MTIAEALDHFERQVAALETALETGSHVELSAFTALAFDGPVAREHIDRVERAMARLDACERRMVAQRTAAFDELDSRRGAASAYLSHT